ncbi:transposase [Candidatus Enterovibrio escicola]|uniref:transposase n=1 Tax=Candidatus Enterovibrio escicola TaxID=1927127 RepID=UPI001237E406|nr:transposase [Candidatus Enterovibrio escacola]
MYGEGEWKIRKHRKEKRQIWCKLHIDFNVSIHQVISAKVSLISVDDNEVLPTLLNPLRRKRQQVNVDGVSNTKACHLLLKNKGISPSILPQSNSDYWKERHPRNEAVKELKEDKLAE